MSHSHVHLFCVHPHGFSRKRETPGSLPLIGHVHWTKKRIYSILVPRASVSFGHVVGETEGSGSSHYYAITGCPYITDIR